MAQGLEKLFVVPESSNGGTAEEKILAPCREVLSHNYPCCGASWLAPVVKNPPANAGDIRDMGSIPGSGRSPEGGHGHPLQYSCLENPMDRQSLAGYGPQGCKESDTTEHTHTCVYPPELKKIVRS